MHGALTLEAAPKVVHVTYTHCCVQIRLGAVPDPRESEGAGPQQAGEGPGSVLGLGTGHGGLHHRDKDRKGAGALPAPRSLGAASGWSAEAGFEAPSCWEEVVID